MPILLRNLDDRRWQDLVDDGRALIPLYGPEWTDHNAHDPGITLVELLAWLAEMDIYQLNRITDRAKLKFLALVGFAPQPPHPAAAVLRLNLQGVTTSVDLPAGVEFSGSDPFGVATRFRILHAVSVLPASLAGVQAKGSAGFRDLTDRWRRGLPFGTFGDVPEPGAELYLGFDQAIPAGQQLSLYFSLTSPHARAEERQRLIAELAAQHQACLPPVITCAENTPPSASISAQPPADVWPFDGVRLAWEALVAQGAAANWVSLPAPALTDDTRSLTLDGTVRLKLPQNLAQATLGLPAGPIATSC